MIFTQFRETASTIRAKLNVLDSVKPEIFIGQAKKANIGLSQKNKSNN